MAEMKVLDMSGAQVSTIDLCDAIFAVEVMQRSECTFSIKDRVHSLLLQEQKFPAAVRNRGARRVQAERDRAAHVLLSGRTAALYLLRSPDPTAQQ